MEALLLAGLTGWFVGLRLRTYLMFFQQEEYDFRRFMAWWWQKRAFDRWLSVGLAVMLPFGWLQPAAAPLMVAVWLWWRGRREPDVTTTGKKPLALTARATQLWLLAGGLAVPFMAFCAVMLTASALMGLVALMVLMQLLPLFLGGAKLVQWPFQQWQNRTFMAEARMILGRLQPRIVSISGAFGKTTTKLLLGRILNSHAPTLVSPGSTNTLLGLARVVREQLQPHHAYFLAEMGAYQVGSIARLCEVFPPDGCATTAIGAAHYERFKTLEAVAQAEFEVLDATLARGGPCVLSVDGIPEHLWRPRVAAAPQIRLVTSTKEWLRAGDYWLKVVTPTPHGLSVAIEHNGQLSVLTTKLYGATMAPNIGTAFALATELGVPKALSAQALAQAEAAPHRLAVRQEGSLTIIDDSYNSNPAGFAAALEVLTLVGAGRRKILITPGMVELGTLHDAAHATVGALAAQHADVVLAVAPQRIRAFTQAVKAAQAEGATVQLQLCATLQDAWGWLRANGMAGDVVLLENDLPDRYEAVWQL